MLINQSNGIAKAAARVNWKKMGQWAVIALILVSPLAMAAGTGTGGGGGTGLAGAQQKACGFFTRINDILNIASVAVVTIAVVFAGYQVAFAHKRITDVAPVLIGGLLIGGAAQIAGMLIGRDNTTCDAGSGTSTTYVMVVDEARNA